MVKKKIIFLATVDWHFSLYRIPLTRALVENNFEVILITNFTTHAKKISSLGVQLVHVELNRSSVNPIKEFHSILKIWKVYKEKKPDLVHHFGIKPILYGSFANYVIEFIRIKKKK